MVTEKPAPEALYPASGLDAGDTSLDEHGREILDPVPMAPPLGYSRQPSLVELVRDMVRGEHLRRAALEDDKDDFETFDNFEIPDDPGDPHSRWENDFDPPVKELLKEGDKSLSEKSRAATERPKEPKGDDPLKEPKATPPKPSSEV